MPPKPSACGQCALATGYTLLEVCAALAVGLWILALWAKAWSGAQAIVPGGHHAAGPTTYQLEQALLTYAAGRPPAEAAAERLYLSCDATGLWRVQPHWPGQAAQCPQRVYCVQLARYVAQPGTPQDPLAGAAPAAEAALRVGNWGQPWQEPCACWRAVCHAGSVPTGPVVAVCYLSQAHWRAAPGP
jgi:hypothetical protein